MLWNVIDFQSKQKLPNHGCGGYVHPRGRLEHSGVIGLSVRLLLVDPLDTCF